MEHVCRRRPAWLRFLHICRLTGCKICFQRPQWPGPKRNYADALDNPENQAAYLSGVDPTSGAAVRCYITEGRKVLAATHKPTEP